MERGMILLVLFLTTVNAQREIKIGVSLTTSSINFANGPDVMKALAIGVEEINSNNQLLPDGKIVLVPKDNEDKKDVAVSNAIELAKSDVVGVVGADKSSISIPVNLVLSSYGILQCSGGSTAPDLSDKTEFPSFFRTVPPDVLQGAALANFVATVGWRKIGIISVGDAYGLGVATNVISNANERKLNVLINQVYNPVAKDYDAILANVKSIGARIIIFIGYYEHAKELLDYARQKDMIGSNYVYIFSEAAAPPAGISEREKRNLEGMIIIEPKERSTLPEYISFEQKYQRKYKSSPSQFSMFYYDCLLSFARALTEKTDGEKLTLSDIMSTSFDGVTGLVKFDDKADRIGYYIFRNYVSGRLVSIAESGANSVIVLTNPITFFSGTSDVPSDSPDSAAGFVELRSVGAITMIAMNSVMAIICVVSIILIFRYRRTNAIRMLSTNFAVPLLVGLIIICGSIVAFLEQPTTITCALQLALPLTGLSMILGSLLAKSLAIYRVFDNPHILTKKDQFVKFVSVILAAVFAELGLIVIWFIADAPSPMLTTETLVWQCYSSSTVQATMTVIAIIYNVILIGACMYFAFAIRDSSHQFGETKFLGFSVYNIFFLSIFVLAIVLAPGAGTSVWFVFYGRSFAILCLVAFTWALLVGRVLGGLIIYGDSDSAEQLKMESKVSLLGKRSAEKMSPRLGGLKGRKRQENANAEPTEADMKHGDYMVRNMNSLVASWRKYRLILFPEPAGFFALVDIRDKDKNVFGMLKDCSVTAVENSEEQTCILELRWIGGVFQVQMTRSDEVDAWVDAFDQNSSGNGGVPHELSKTLTPSQVRFNV